MAGLAQELRGSLSTKSSLDTEQVANPKAMHRNAPDQAGITMPEVPYETVRSCIIVDTTGVWSGAVGL